MKIILFLTFFICSTTFASSTRSLDADQIQSADHTKTFTMPSTTGTLLVSGNVAIAAQFVRDSFTANSSTTGFTLSFTPGASAQVEVFLNGILQIITTDYTISGTTLTFVTAPITGQDIKAIYSKY